MHLHISFIYKYQTDDASFKSYNYGNWPSSSDKANEIDIEIQSCGILQHMNTVHTIRHPDTAGMTSQGCTLQPNNFKGTYGIFFRATFIEYTKQEYFIYYGFAEFNF